MTKSIYVRRIELYKEWTKLREQVSENENITFEDHMILNEKEDNIYKKWLFYDKLLKRMEVVKYGNKKKNCCKKENSTNKRI